MVVTNRELVVDPIVLASPLVSELCQHVIFLKEEKRA